MAERPTGINHEPSLAVEHVTFDPNIHSVGLTQVNGVRLISLTETNGHGLSQFVCLPRDFLLRFGKASRNEYGTYEEFKVPMILRAQQGSRRQAGKYELHVSQLNLDNFKRVILDLVCDQFVFDPKAEATKTVLSRFVPTPDAKPIALVKKIADLFTSSDDQDPQRRLIVQIHQNIERQITDEKLAQRLFLCLYLEMIGMRDVALDLMQKSKEIYTITTDSASCKLEIDLDNFRDIVPAMLVPSESGGFFTGVNEIVIRTQGDIDIRASVRQKTFVSQIQHISLEDLAKIKLPPIYQSTISQYDPILPEFERLHGRERVLQNRLSIDSNEQNTLTTINILLDDSDHITYRFPPFPKHDLKANAGVVISGPSGTVEHIGNVVIEGMRGNIFLGNVRGNVTISNCQGRIVFGEIVGDVTIANCENLQGEKIYGNFQYDLKTTANVKNVIAPPQSTRS